MWPIAIPLSPLLVAVDDLYHAPQVPAAAAAQLVGIALEALFGVLLVYQYDAPRTVWRESALGADAAAALLFQAPQSAINGAHRPPLKVACRE